MGWCSLDWVGRVLSISVVRKHRCSRELGGVALGKKFMKLGIGMEGFGEHALL